LEPIRKYLLAGGLFVILLAAVGIALILASRWLTGSEAVRKKIAAEATRLTGGQLRYEKLALHLLPLPHLTAEQVDFQLPGKVALNTAAMAIYPDFTALLTGSLELDDFVLDRPGIRVEVAHRPPPAGPAAKVDLQKELKETLAAFFSALARLGPDLKIKVRNGQVTVLRPDRADLNLEQINLSLRSREQLIDVALGCFSSLSGQLSIKGRVNLESRSSSGRLKVDALNARAVMAELPPFPGITVSDTRLGLDVKFITAEAEKIEAKVAARLPDVRIQRQKRRLELQDVVIEGDINADFKSLAWDIKTLKIASRNLELESRGKFIYGSPSQPSSLILDAVGRRIDVAAVAQSFTEFAGDQGWVQTAFRIARAGTLTKATCHLEARQTDKGWTVPQLKASGHLDQGLIFIPGAEMNLESVSGEILLVNQRVDFRQMSVHLLFGYYEQLNARIDWQRKATLSVTTPRGTVRLEDFYQWLTAFEGFQVLRRHITTADGKLAVTQLELGGALTSPAEWESHVTAIARDVTITSPELAGPLYLTGGTFGFKLQSMAFEKMQVRYLDAEAVASGKTMGRPGQFESLHLALDGSFGGQALAWMRRFIDLPEHLRVKPPVNVSGLDLQWDNRGKVAVKGELATAGGVRAITDAVLAPGDWQIKRFELNDGLSDISVKLSRRDQRIDLDFAGKLQKETLDRILKKNETLQGWVAGEIKASLDINNPRATNITGTLRGEGLVVRLLPVSAIEFKRFHLNCQGKTAELDSADLIFADTQMQLKGTAGITAEAYTFDLDLVTDHLDADAFSKIRKAAPEQAATPATDAHKKPPINGVIRFRTPRFTFKDYTWSPVEADVAFWSDTVDVNITRADLCGIATPGTVTIKPDGLHLAFRPSAARKDLQATWECLQARPLRAESLYSLAGTIETRGTTANLMENLTGEIAFSSDDGMIYRATLLTRIIAFLNITEDLIGEESGLDEKGFGYDAIRAHAYISGGTLDVDEFLVDGHSMKISGEGEVNLVDKTLDVTLLAAPLKTFDRVVRKIPVVGYITGGSVLSVPIRISGSFADYQVRPLPPGAVGRGLMGIMERTLKAPLKVVESLPGLEGRAEPSAESKKNNSSATEP